jgi:serine/threonine protein kinase
MAPEQTRGEQADFRADLFALGVVLYRMSTGEHPFAAADALSTMVAIATKDPIAPQMQNFDVPIELSDLIMKLLEKDPAKRDISAQQVADSLQQIDQQLRGEGSATPSGTKSGTGLNRAPVAPASADTPAPKRQKKQQVPWLLIGAAVGGVFLCLMLTLVIATIVLFG